tara:strand:+ start:1866 stop:2033 length:168 start_codon:yes stop_codon:yes gene_type:complete
MSAKREALLEIQLQHTVSVLEMLLGVVIPKKSFPVTVNMVQEIIDNTTKLLEEKE